MSCEELKKEFTRKSFREILKKELGEICVNCGAKEHIEYHHIVPLINGGTNRLTNIAPLCIECHKKAHDRQHFVSKNGGRPQAISYEDAEPILKEYFDKKIGAKELKEKLGLSPKNKSTHYRLINEYKKRHKISKNFKNTVDLIQNKQEYYSNRNLYKPISYEEAEPFLEKYFNQEIGTR